MDKKDLTSRGGATDIHIQEYVFGYVPFNIFMDKLDMKFIKSTRTKNNITDLYGIKGYTLAYMICSGTNKKLLISSYVSPELYDASMSSYIISDSNNILKWERWVNFNGKSVLKNGLYGLNSKDASDWLINEVCMHNIKVGHI